MIECVIHPGYYQKKEEDLCPKCEIKLRRDIMQTNATLRRWRDKNKDHYEKIKDSTPFRPIGKKMSQEIRRQKEHLKKGKIEQIQLSAFTSSFAENLRRHMNKHHSDVPFVIEVKKD